MDVAGDQAGAEEAEAGRPGPVAGEPVRGQRGRGGGAGRADDRALQHGERVAGGVVVEDQHGRGPRDARRPRCSGKLEIHFRPSTRFFPPIEAGRAMIREVGRSGKRRKYDGGLTESPGAVQPVGGLHELGDLLLATLQRPLHLCAGDDGERRRVVHRGASSRRRRHRVGAGRDEHLAGALVGLPAVRGAGCCPPAAGRPRCHGSRAGVLRRTTSLISCDDVVADRVAVAEAGGERQAVRAVDVHQVVADVRVHRPLVEERDLVEPAAQPGPRVRARRRGAAAGCAGRRPAATRTRSRSPGSSARPPPGRRCRTTSAHEAPISSL